ncbi:M43 family zinc metalloprotease [Mesoflavibacter sp. CH_XMU1422-2]|uniref:M43 family zinc metalloprotease n=1 Tax=Mesoflavibacter sp. CH_XMU1422-2 TaxID=3107770 RepID=UPI00300BA2A9
MKNSTLSALLFILFVSFSLKAQNNQNKKATNGQNFQLTDQTKESINQTGFARCLTDENEKALQQQYRNRADRTDFENWLAPKIAEIKANRASQRSESQQVIYNIPVVIHVVHTGEAVGTGPNITDAQALSQIQVLNEDYRRLAGTPGGANTTGLAVDVEINFCIAQVDPNGAPTTGVVRHNITPYSNSQTPADPTDWETRTNVESMKSVTQWDPTKYLNMWTINPGGNPLNDFFNPGLGGLLGYAQFPDNTPNLQGLNATGGAASTDGVVAGYYVMGTIAEDDGTFMLDGTNNLGRTMTHEVGHWLGLRHIWGDGDCSADDFCADTPNAAAPNYTCNLFNNSCTDNPDFDQVQNYMDYTNDACMDTFTQDQKDRIQAIMANAPRRVELNSSTACSISPTVYVTTALPENVTEGSDCNFQDITIDLTMSIAGNASATASLVNTGTATENEDFELINNSVTFASGSTTPSNSVTLRIFNDNFVEADETISLSVNVSTTGNVTASSNVYETMIINDDEAVTTTTTTDVFFDDFNDGDVSDWSFIDSDGDTNNWIPVTLTDSGLGAGDFSVLRSFSWVSSTGALTPDNWAITPAIDLTSVTGSLQLQWKIAAVDADWDVENYTVYVATSNTITALQASPTSFNESTLDGINTLTTRTLDISSFIGQTIYVGFRHHNVSDQFSIELDDVRVSATFDTSVQTDVNTSTPDQFNLLTSGLVYSTDVTTGDIMTDIDNTSGFNYGCTTVAVSRDVATAGADAVAYNGGTDPAGYVTAKTFDITTANASTSDAATINFYFTQAEISAWETATGNTINDLFVLNETTGEVVAVTNSTFGSDYKLTANLSMGIAGTYYFGSQLAFLSNNDFELANSISIYPNPTVSVLNIKVDNQNDMPDSYKVYNMLGQLLIDNKINNTSDLTIDTTPFSDGMYFIKISKSNRNLTLPFIKK